MTDQTQAPVETKTTTEVKDLSTPDLSFAEYETLRRGGTVKREVAPSAPEAKSSEQKLGQTESETAAAETETESEAPESNTQEEPGESEEGVKPESDKPKKKSGFQKRVDKLNARIADREREVEYWRSQALKGAGAESKKDEPNIAPDPQSKSAEPDPNQFETHSEYVKAVAKWAAAEERKVVQAELDKSKAQEEHKKAVMTYLDRKEAFAKKTPDFEEVISEVDDIPMSAAVSELIINSENGPELAYELAKNRDDFVRICKLPPFLAAREIGKFEAKISQKASEGKVETKKLTSAPKPLAPVGTGKGTANTKSITDPNISQAEYERLRKEQIKQRRQTG